MKSILHAFALLSFVLFSSSAIAMEAPENVDGALTINAQEAKVLHDQGELFIDLRMLDDFKKGHIPHAISIDLTMGFDESGLTKLADKDKTIVFYCYGKACMRSSIASKRAVEWGFSNIKYFRDGLPAWRSAGFPIAP